MNKVRIGLWWIACVVFGITLHQFIPVGTKGNLWIYASFILTFGTIILGQEMAEKNTADN